MTELKVLLGRRIKELRKNQNIKQEELAEKINIATRNLSNLETGRCFPSPENLEKIAIALNCKVKDLFDFEHQKDNSELFKEIINRIKPVNRERLQDFYKITCALTD
ncbi:helix-turn-helix transcriptional regulator [bacterium]|nr:helix-turn-helix transcriptional regulator [bacterium]